MIYCISDIHGEKDRFLSMLKKINFSEDDTLYIIGDVIDRFPGGVDMIRVIMNSPNMHMLLGNHEQMCLYTLGPNNALGSRQLWEGNGGGCTYSELVSLCTPDERKEIIDFLMQLPESIDITVSGRKFHLVHAFPGDSSDVRLWERYSPNVSAPLPNSTVIAGHTPTCFLTEVYDEPYVIWHGNGIINIDCGCGHSSEYRQLGCLRLNDMAEFYT